MSSLVEAAAHWCETPLTFYGRRLFLSYLGGLKYHTLSLSEKKSAHEYSFGGDRLGHEMLSADMKLVNPQAFFTKLLLHTDVGFAEAYMAG